MKKIVFLLFICVITLTSCSLDNDNTPSYYLEITPIEDITMPEEFVHGQTHEIFMTYNRPNDCYVFNNFAYHSDGNERTIAVVNTVYTDASCNDLNETEEVSFNFLVTSTEPYIFKFYQGENDEGEDQYYIIEIPVVE